ncbi:MAG: Transcriptional regulatory protein CseB [Phycisphaerae bacterium]|nr:Transcriptional regulatory protein CseB [Phycisphaerae bacterium]
MNSPAARILLIDDDPLVHDAVKMILEPEGYQVEGCLTGPAGLEALRARRPDVLLLDIMLAKPSEGFHLVYKLKEYPELREIPIIVLSAIRQSYGFDFAQEVGSEFLPVQRFLEKPIDAATLREAVRQALSEHEART